MFVPKPPSSQQLGGFDVPCSSEGFWSMLLFWFETKTVIAVVVLLLPARSTALTAIVCEPFETEREFQL